MPRSTPVSAIASARAWSREVVGDRHGDQSPVENGRMFGHVRLSGEQLDPVKDRRAARCGSVESSRSGRYTRNTTAPGRSALPGGNQHGHRAARADDLHLHAADAQPPRHGESRAAGVPAIADATAHSAGLGPGQRCARARSESAPDPVPPPVRLKLTFTAEPGNAGRR